MADDLNPKDLNNEFDGIQEHERIPPKWWIGLFIITWIAGIGYFLHYNLIGAGDSQIVEFKKQINPDYRKAEFISDASFFGIIQNRYGLQPPFQIKNEPPTPREYSEITDQINQPFVSQILSAMYAADRSELEKLKKNFPDIFEYYLSGYKPAGIDALASIGDEEKQNQFLANLSDYSPLDDEGSLQSGVEIFKKECVSCHGEQGGGGIGPNLTDEYWIHGGGFSDILRTIYNGVPEKGMVSWGGILTNEQIVSVASYITTLRGTNPPDAKGPEGEKTGG